MCVADDGVESDPDYDIVWKATCWTSSQVYCLDTPTEA